ncbi:AT-hook motif nuclear-localized protein 2-like [Impatiens glandulifera]|uniref:AT-hook motif nuclear-localized protein 2-like n=1 Tax=Impatiens glandulifera TaxID=253017 RepID=UPI001FB0A65A|nr:AT-hook motif nuclear-localized protein 2-like [Impatiens glandulifera]
MRKTPSKLLKPYQNLIAQSKNLRLRESSTRDAPPIAVVPIATAPPADEDVEAAEAEEFVESTFANVGDEDDEADDEGHEDPQDVDEEEEHGSTPDPSSTGKGNSNSGYILSGSDVPSNYRVVRRTDNNNPNETGGSSQVGPTLESVSVEQGNTGLSTTPARRRGRPRKYIVDGSALPPIVLSPQPLSMSAPPLLIDYGDKGKARAVGPVIDDQRLSFFGARFTPHIIIVNAGEDVAAKILSFSQEGSRAICILSGSGAVSTVTLSSLGGTIAHEGRFEILSLNGSFTPSENGGTRNRVGGISVSLASSDGGRILGGVVAGSLVAATPVQIVVGSFIHEKTE